MIELIIRATSAKLSSGRGHRRTALVSLLARSLLIAGRNEVNGPAAIPGRAARNVNPRNGNEVLACALRRFHPYSTRSCSCSGAVATRIDPSLVRDPLGHVPRMAFADAARHGVTRVMQKKV